MVKKIKEKTRTCPKCNKKYNQFPALSRRDNKTLICPPCGTEEALNDYFGYMAKDNN